MPDYIKKIIKLVVSIHMLCVMKKNNIRRLLVWDDSRPIGTISQKMIVGNMGKLSIVLPELEIPGKIVCPYCSSEFEDKNILSHHIDDVHIGKGLLEGNLEQFQ